MLGCNKLVSLLLPSCMSQIFCLVDQVDEVKGEDVVCVIKNTATLTGSLFTLHASQIRIDLPTLSEKDEEVSHWGICASLFVHLLNDIVAY